MATTLARMSLSSPTSQSLPLLSSHRSNISLLPAPYPSPLLLPSSFKVSAQLSARRPKRRLVVLPLRRLRLSATQADDLPPSKMTLESALQLLGVREGATFDEILRAKKTVVDSCGGDQERLIQVEAAYDLILMQSLEKRFAGKVSDSSVRFADVPKPGSSLPPWLKSALKSAPVSVEKPAGNTLAAQAAFFAALGAWTYVGGLGQSTDGFQQLGGSDIPGTQLALSFGASLYFLRQQNVKLGKASLLTLGGVLAGALVGTLAESWLRVDIFPVLGVSSPAVLVSEFAFLSLWLSSAYLR
eukprot:TRINITY_DN26432_c0_g1_i1.p1 TRINITY_DN26432_c0_g1~~TRINITY_DN26432_c0_g1_i1.p1  ORF type:complete len:300 (+),score=45.60 TRINITY_DN26432_c0_g1_i1:319-1218(+)